MDVPEDIDLGWGWLDLYIESFRPRGTTQRNSGGRRIAANRQTSAVHTERSAEDGTESWAQKRAGTSPVLIKHMQAADLGGETG